MTESDEASDLPPHLAERRSNRGFAYYPPVFAVHGGMPQGDVRVYESSAAFNPAIWLCAKDLGVNADQPEREIVLHLPVEQAWHLAEQLAHLVARHYQGDARPARRYVDLTEDPTIHPSREEQTP